jgi:orotidine-5'-phosphate decarboxylase
VDPKDRLIVALDDPSETRIMDLVRELSPVVGWFKVGAVPFSAVGPRLIRQIAETGAKVMLDLKLHDIPNTVARAVEAAVPWGVSMLTVHAAGTSKMIRAAVAAAHKLNARVIAVTLLTSITDDELHDEMLFMGSRSEYVESLASIALSAGVDALVCSTLEVAMLRSYYPEIDLIVPGIRPLDAKKDDQERVGTPSGAIQAGASFIVVGRPIIEAPSPLQAAKDIVAEIAGS